MALREETVTRGRGADAHRKALPHTAYLACSFARAQGLGLLTCGFRRRNEATVRAQLFHTNSPRAPPLARGSISCQHSSHHMAAIATGSYQAMTARDLADDAA